MWVDELHRQVTRLRNDQPDGAGGPTLRLLEALPEPGDLWLRDRQGRPYHAELVVPVVLRDRTRMPEPTTTRAAVPPTTTRRWLPGDEWIHLKLYAGANQHDGIIAGPLRALLADESFDRLTDRWFFIRYVDPRPHLRLRFHAGAPELAAEVMSRCAAWARGLVRDGQAIDLAFCSYDREVERYGGGHTIDAVESVFWADSEVATALVHLVRTGGGQFDPDVVRVVALHELYRAWGADPLSDNLSGVRVSDSARKRFRSFGRCSARSLSPGSVVPIHGLLSIRPGWNRCSPGNGNCSPTLAGTSARLPRADCSTCSERNVIESLAHIQSIRLAGPDRDAEQLSRRGRSADAQSATALTTVPRLRHRGDRTVPGRAHPAAGRHSDVEMVGRAAHRGERRHIGPNGARYMLADDADPQLVAAKVIHPEFPRSAAYDPVWQARYADGPNPLWLVESLTELVDLRPGMRVLDLGSGWAISSIFLAREFGVTVVAADQCLYRETWPLIVEAGMQSQVMPIRVEAHDLRFAPGYFDVIISVDAYQYFGTDDLYLGYLQNFLAPDGALGVVLLGVTEELGDAAPEHLGDTWTRNNQAFHSPRWWRDHLNRSGQLTVEHADLVPDGWRHALRWQELAAAAAPVQYREACADWARRLAVEPPHDRMATDSGTKEMTTAGRRLALRSSRLRRWESPTAAGPGDTGGPAHSRWASRPPRRQRSRISTRSARPFLVGTPAAVLLTVFWLTPIGYWALCKLRDNRWQTRVVSTSLPPGTVSLERDDVRSAQTVLIVGARERVDAAVANGLVIPQQGRRRSSQNVIPAQKAMSERRRTPVGAHRAM